MYAAIWTAISLVLALALPAHAAGCRDVSFEATSFTVCEADPATEDVRLFLSDRDGQPLGTFDNLDAQLSEQGQSLAFAMNGGMYHPDRRPVGLFIEDGETLSPIVTREGPGNFGLLPNGVLCLGETTARIFESRRFDREKPACLFASQSGPMLVIDGALHPRFIPNSSSQFVRNGVGVTADGRLLAVISNQRVNFHRFARFFRDVLQAPNALYFDGKVSRLYAPDRARHDIGFPMGPILGVVRPAD
ncbi:MAG: hypothetical protein EX266_02875 [Rhodobacteraceae bacterium]|nr:MAG: hypothetical protein EX266_02875 [Paracoccaceae bacterium]